MNSDKITYIIVVICLAIIFIFTPLFIEAKNNDIHAEELFSRFSCR